MYLLKSSQKCALLYNVKKLSKVNNPALGENFPNLVTLLSHCPHPLIFVNKLVYVVLVYSYFAMLSRQGTFIWLYG
jgi:hypothetical protein